MRRSAGTLSWILLLMLFVPGAAGSQTRDTRNDTLAEVGGRSITVRDLIERVELMPWPGKDDPGQKDSMLIRALASLVAQDILALEAASHGGGRDSLTRSHVHNLEKLLVRDALYMSRVKSAVSVTDGELREGLKRYALQVRIQMITTADRGEAARIAEELRRSRSPDSALSSIRELPGVGCDTVTVRFGMLEQQQEDAVYNLTPSNPVSKPVAVEQPGWAVLRLLGTETNAEYSKSTVGERVHATEGKIRLRKEIELADRYSAQILAPHRATATPRMFKKVAGVLRTLLGGRKADGRPEGPYRLSTVIDTAFIVLAPSLKQTLVAMEGDDLTVGDVLETWRILDVIFPTLEEKDFLRRLNAAVRKAVALELLSREGYREQMEKSAGVGHDLAIWSEYWQAISYELGLVKDVGIDEGELRDTLAARVAQFGNDYEVNVREILVSDLREALVLRDTIQAGAEMRTLARESSRRKEWAARDGESGFFPVIRHPEIGVRALDAEKGELVGPVKVPEGYSVFAVLDVRRKAGDTVYSWSTVRRAVQQQLLLHKRERVLNEYIAAKAASYNVRMHFDRLAGVDVPKTNIVTRRFLGFGGSMLAAPPLTPLWYWLENIELDKFVTP